MPDAKELSNKTKNVFKSKPKMVPLRDYIYIQPLAPENVGKIVMLESKQLRYQKGIVIAVGTGTNCNNGTVIPPSVKVGDLVLWQHLGAQVQTPYLDGILVKESEIYAVEERDINE